MEESHTEEERSRLVALGAASAHLEPSQSADLRLYSSLCKQVAESSFFSESIKLSLESQVTLEHAGSDALRSMAMAFRQLWMQGSPTRFGRIHGILRESIRSQGYRVDATLDETDEIARRFRGACRAEMMKTVKPDDTMGTPVKVHSAKSVVDDWLNGGQFHTDPAAVERIERWHPVGYEFAVAKSMHAIFIVMLDLDALVRGVLLGSNK